MPTLQQHLAAPDLAVIDLAIDRIDCGRNTMSCIALWDAVVDTIPHEFNDAIMNRYTDQYELFVRSLHGGQLPSWWSVSGDRPLEEVESNRRARLKMLRAFRQACVDAAANINA